MRTVAATAPRHSYFAWYAISFLLGVLLGLGPSVAGAESSKPPCFENQIGGSFLFENDLWGSGSDKHFTHGGRFSLLVGRKKVGEPGNCVENRSGFVAAIRDLADILAGKRTLKFESNQLSLILGQNIFTPEYYGTREIL